MNHQLHHGIFLVPTLISCNSVYPNQIALFSVFSVKCHSQTQDRKTPDVAAIKNSTATASAPITSGPAAMTTLSVPDSAPSYSPRYET